MYESPIQIIMGEIQTHYEDEILKAIQKYDVTVDKEELIKALQHDRKQYDKGYKDGCAETFKRCVDVLITWSQETFHDLPANYLREIWSKKFWSEGVMENETDEL